LVVVLTVRQQRRHRTTTDAQASVFVCVFIYLVENDVSDVCFNLERECEKEYLFAVNAVCQKSPPMLANKQNNKQYKSTNATEIYQI